jgi:hypothetical protein
MADLIYTVLLLCALNGSTGCEIQADDERVHIRGYQSSYVITCRVLDELAADCVWENGHALPKEYSEAGRYLSYRSQTR